MRNPIRYLISLAHRRPPPQLTPQQRAALADALHIHRPEQPCWADQPLRDHILAALETRFGDDFNWALQVALAIHFLNPATPADADRILAEHTESRSGHFPPELHTGRGWNPAEVHLFNADTRTFWRAYRALSDTQWSSIELPRHPATSAEYHIPSGFSFSGTRGCVQHIQLQHTVTPQQAPTYAPKFQRAAHHLLAHACPGEPAETLWQAVIKQEPTETPIGPALARFRLNDTRQDWTQPAEHRFTLTLDWR